jgi:radical SAM protein with 4Fe4S-binding SPASM domain
MFKELDKDTKKLFDKKFLSRTTALELVINEKCQNSCTYCYRKFKHVKSPVFSVEPSQVKTMVDRFLNVIQEDAKDFFKNRKIELFGGDGLIDYQYTKKLLKILDEYNPKGISIPTNGRLVSELTSYDLESLFDGINTDIGLSLSVDGDITDKQRPLSKIGKMLSYDEKINYDKLFKIAKKYGYGYHPMLSFNKVDSWLDTIKYFFETYGIVPYLLEVRHSLSKENAIKAVIQIARIRDYYAFIDEKAVEMANTIRASRTPRGLGCSALTTAVIMPNGDMPFCHRLIDPPWVYGNVNYGLDITKAISLHTIYNHKNVPECFICPLRDYCNGLCQGACYEYWGDPWIPIPSVCDYYLLKNYIFSLKYDDWKQMLKPKINELKESVIEAFGEDTIKHIMDTI